jgi:hypothetical protein
MEVLRCLSQMPIVFRYDELAKNVQHFSDQFDTCALIGMPLEAMLQVLKASVASKSQNALQLPEMLI